MRKLILTATAVCTLVASALAGGNGNTTTKSHDEPVAGGFFLNGQIGVYGPKYLVNKEFASDLTDDQKVTMIGYGLELGNMFELSDLGSGGDMAIGVRAIWFGFQSHSGSNDLIKRKGLNLSFVSPGLYFSKALGDNAVDVFANVVPTFGYTVSKIKDGGEFSDIDFGAGYPVKLGGNFRRGILSLGLEYNIGTIGYTINDTDIKTSANHLRFNIGMKF